MVDGDGIAECAFGFSHGLVAALARIRHLIAGSPDDPRRSGEDGHAGLHERQVAYLEIGAAMAVVGEDAAAEILQPGSVVEVHVVLDRAGIVRTARDG
jgi:hypothetical protein